MPPGEHKGIRPGIGGAVYTNQGEAALGHTDCVSQRKPWWPRYQRTSVAGRDQRSRNSGLYANRRRVSVGTERHIGQILKIGMVGNVSADWGSSAGSCGCTGRRHFPAEHRIRDPSTPRGEQHQPSGPSRTTSLVHSFSFLTFSFFY